MTGQRGFAMVPAWLMAKKPKGNDVLIYCTLASHGTWNPGTGVYESCKPSIELMADETGLSRSTVKRALENLIKLSAIKRTLRYTPEGDPAPSLYRVIFGQVVEPPAEQGVGSSVDRPPAASDTSTSQGGRSTGEPTSVHGRTEGRSTDEPRVGPPVDRNQEPLNQKPMTKSSVPASQVRRTDAEDEDQPDGQITIYGDVDRSAIDAQQAAKLNQDAMGIARGWVDFRAEHGCPVVMRGKADPLIALRNLLLPALTAGYTEKQVKMALPYCDTGVPGTQQLERALAAVQAGWRPGHNWKPGQPHDNRTPGRQRTGPMAGTNRHVDDISAEQREHENPFRTASRQSDYANGEGAVA